MIKDKNQLEKTMEAIKAYKKALVDHDKSTKNVQDKLAILKNASGENTVEEAMQAIGNAHVDGLFD